MSDRTAARLALSGFAVVALAGVLLRPAMPIDETRYLAVAWEMWLSGDWLVPSKNFALYTHKPPLLFWAINAIWSVTGVSETAARLVGPGFALLTIVLTGRLARALWPEDEGAASRAVIALSGLLAFAFFGGLTMFDAALAAATVGAMLALVRAVATGDRRAWALLGVAVALGVLAKGPVILVHVVPAVLSIPFWSGKHPGRRTPRELATGAGLALLVALAVVALWLVPAIVSGGPEYRNAVLWSQSAGRVTDSFAHARPWWFYLALLPLLLFPWAFMPGLWRAGQAADWSAPPLRLCLVWASSALLLFSLISGKQTHYLVPELPAAALVVAHLARTGRGTIVPAALPVLLLAAVGIGLAGGWIPVGRIDTLLHPRAALVAWVLLVLAICWLAIRTGGLRGGAALSLGLLLSLNLGVGLTDTGGLYDSGRIAKAIAPHEDAGLAYYGRLYHAEFNFAGRLTRAVAAPVSESDLIRWVRTHPDGLIVARADRATPPWPPRTKIPFRNSPYAIWHAADAPEPEPSP